MYIYGSNTGAPRPGPFWILGTSFEQTLNISDQFKNIMRYIRIGYNINVMQQSACLAINPITVDSLASLLNCTTVGRASDSMRGPK